MKQKIKYKIGDKITFYATVNFYSSWPTRIDRSFIREMCREELEIPEVGVITGATYKFTGKGFYGWSGTDFEGYPDSESGYLNVEKSIFVYTVKLGLMNKDLYVLPEDTLINFSNCNIPNKYIPKTIWSEKARNLLREEMKKSPRDAKGRWIKTKVESKQ